MGSVDIESVFKEEVIRGSDISQTPNLKDFDAKNLMFSSYSMV